MEKLSCIFPLAGGHEVVLVVVRLIEEARYAKSHLCQGGFSSKYLDLKTPLYTHFTHYGYMDSRINHDLTPSNASFTLTILLCIRYYRHANVVAYTGL